MFYIIERLHTLERLDQLIQRKATGKPAELADRFGISRRSVYTLMDELRAFGAEIRFDRCYGSYVYTTPIKFSFQVVECVDNPEQITGGQCKIPELFSGAKYLRWWPSSLEG